jgi:hypothetical protein
MLAYILTIVCTHAYIQTTAVYENLGEPTEAALRVLVEKLMTDDAAFNATLAAMPPAQRYMHCLSVCMCTCMCVCVSE